jgi:hypothetical protein
MLLLQHGAAACHLLHSAKEVPVYGVGQKQGRSDVTPASS